MIIKQFEKCDEDTIKDCIDDSKTSSEEDLACETEVNEYCLITN